MRALAAIFVSLAYVTICHGGLRLPKIFTDHMVLQQEQPIVVWGWAEGGEPVAVSVAGRSAETVADGDGRWRVELPAVTTDGGKPHTLIVKGGDTTIALKDVLIGEVWLASGQSNMNRPVGGDAIKTADHPQLRLFTTNGKIPRRETLNDTVGWSPCTPESIAACGDLVRGGRRAFSEVAYHFAKNLHARLKVPVGIIHTSMGGTTAVDWTPNPSIAEEFPFDADPGDVRHKKGIVYQARLHGLIPFAIRGVVWYQGEDDGRNKNYARDLTAMIAAWRRLWKRDELPFYMAQIAQTTYASGMLGIYEAQAEVARRVPHTGLAPSNDLQDKRLRIDAGNAKRNIAGTGWPIVAGSNPHPPNKHLIGERLANIALAKTYAMHKAEVFGPIFESREIVGDKIVLKLRHAGKRLKSQDGEPLTWFEISDGSKDDERPNARLVYVKAEAKIVGTDTIEVSAPGIDSPVFARFAWHALARHNLVNSEGLAANPFRTDTLPQMWNRR